MSDKKAKSNVVIPSDGKAPKGKREKTEEGNAVYSIASNLVLTVSPFPFPLLLYREEEGGRGRPIQCPIPIHGLEGQGDDDLRSTVWTFYWCNHSSH